MQTIRELGYQDIRECRSKIYHHCFKNAHLCFHHFLFRILKYSKKNHYWMMMGKIIILILIKATAGLTDVRLLS